MRDWNPEITEETLCDKNSGAVGSVRKKNALIQKTASHAGHPAGAALF